MFQRDHFAIAGGGHVDVSLAQGLLDRRDLEAFHRGLQGVDGINLGDDDTRSEAAQTVRAALANVAIAAHHRGLAGDHHAKGAFETVGERFAAAV